MMKTDDFLPEGSYGTLPSVRQALHSLEGLRRAQDEGRILEAPALRCTAAHDLLFDFGFARGVMPRACCALGIAEGQVRQPSPIWNPSARSSTSAAVCPLSSA